MQYVGRNIENINTFTATCLDVQYVRLRRKTN